MYIHSNFVDTALRAAAVNVEAMRLNYVLKLLAVV